MTETTDTAVSTLPGSDAACYRALESHDARFDGRFFVGVNTTGIYCRPVCRARLPKQKNCTFFGTAPAAEKAGFRPCLRCRPETAPGWSTTDISSQLAQAAARMIESGLHNGERISQVAQQLGVSDRHLRRLFDTSFGVTPVAYMQTQRLLLAKRLLTDTDLSVTRVAEAAGFNSTRRLNASMRKSYQLTPTQLRNQRQLPANTQTDKNILRFNLAVRQPCDFHWMLEFFRSRAIDGLEAVDQHSYSRVLDIQTSDGPLIGWFKISQPDSNIQLEVSAELAPVISTVLSVVRNLFDLDASPAHYLDNLGELAAQRPGLRLPGAASGFELSVRAVLGQQITVKAARTLAQRFVNRFGTRCEFSGQPALTHTFPSADKIQRARKSSIASLGIIGRRADTIRVLAKQVATGQLDLSPTAPVEKTISQLNDTAGIGDWTAQYIAMRALRWPDAFPAADYGVMKALEVSTPARARAVAEQWRPWRAYAVMHLWASLKPQ